MTSPGKETRGDATTETRVVVVGGGIIGAACALKLAREGVQVEVIESGPQWGSGCSTGNAGLITPSRSLPLASKANIREGLRSFFNADESFRMTLHSSMLGWMPRFLAASVGSRARRNRETLLRMGLRSSQLYDDLEAQGVTCPIERGLLHAYSVADAWDQAKLTARKDSDAGLTVQVLNADEARRFEPALSPATIGALYYVDDSYCDPLAMTLALGRAAEAAGAVFRPHTELLGWRIEGGVIHSALTTAGAVHADAFVLAAGSVSGRLSKLAGVPLLIEPGKGYSLDVASDYVAPSRAVLLPEGHCVVTPFEGRTRMTSKLELTGDDFGVSEKSATGILDIVAVGLQTASTATVLGVWRGMRPCSPDGLPFIGRMSPLPNLIAATGHGMLGVTLAPLTAEWVADVLLNRAGQDDPDLHEARPDRFAHPVRRALGRHRTNSAPTPAGKRRVPALPGRS